MILSRSCYFTLYCPLVSNALWKIVFKIILFNSFHTYFVTIYITKYFSNIWYVFISVKYIKPLVDKNKPYLHRGLNDLKFSCCSLNCSLVHKINKVNSEIFIKINFKHEIVSIFFHCKKRETPIIFILHFQIKFTRLYMNFINTLKKISEQLFIKYTISVWPIIIEVNIQS